MKVAQIISTLMLAVALTPISNKEILKNSRSAEKSFKLKKDLSFVFKSDSEMNQGQEAEQDKVVDKTPFKKVLIQTSGAKNEPQ